MSVIGKKITDFTTKWTSVTVTEAGVVVNEEVDTGPLGTGVITTTFGPPVDAARETGPFRICGILFAPDGAQQSVTGERTWRNSGHHKREVKNYILTGDGQRMFVVEEHDLATRSAKGTTYSLD